MDRISPLVTDSYQLSMIAGYHSKGIHNDPSVFYAFYRKSPLGEYAVFAGLRNILNYLENFKFTDDEVEYLRKKKYSKNEEFYRYLKDMDMSDVKVYSVKEGSIIFPRIPALKVTGPLAKCQLIETAILGMINYPSLVASYTSKIRSIIGSKTLLEFGLRRIPGLTSGLVATEASYIGGADGTSNEEADFLLGIPAVGTVAHSYITNHEGLNPNEMDLVLNVDGKEINLWEQVSLYRKKMGDPFTTTVESELVAFVHQACDTPENIIALVDTYNTLESGILNFIVVANVLREYGINPKGIRLDSGDLAYLSNEAKKLMATYMKYNDKFSLPKIFASNDLSYKVIKSLNQQGHSIDGFGIGTNLVNPMTHGGALGFVYKCGERLGVPQMKNSDTDAKKSFPGSFTPYRLYNKSGYPYIDLLVLDSEKTPEEKSRIHCFHPLDTKKQVYFTPSKVEPLLDLVWDGKKCVEVNPEKSKRKLLYDLNKMRPDHLRDENPTPYKISMSEDMYNLFHSMIAKHLVIKEIS